MLTMDYQEFLNRLQKRGSKPHRISHCYGARDAWRWVRGNKWQAFNGHPFPQSLYSHIVGAVNQFLIEQLLEGHKIHLPCGMGTLYLASIPSKVHLEGSSLKTNYRTDWQKTLRLWYDDADARNKHQLVKRIQKDIVFIKYDKSGANYTNKKYYHFRANRSLVRKVGKAIEEGSATMMKINKNND